MFFRAVYIYINRTKEHMSFREKNTENDIYIPALSCKKHILKTVARTSEYVSGKIRSPY
jgi:hypothetical protein